MKGLNCGPCGRGCGPSGPYISAYEIAVKHGYQGSERDWIRSIGQWKVIRATQASGNAFECDTLLSDVFADLEHGIVPVMLYEDRVLAFLTEGGDDYIGFGTLMYRDGGTDKYDVYTMSRRGNTVQTRTVSGGGEGGEGWAPGNNSIEYMMLQEDIRASLEKAESAVQPAEMTAAIEEAIEGLEPGGTPIVTGDSNLYVNLYRAPDPTSEVWLTDTTAGQIYTAMQGTDRNVVLKDGSGRQAYMIKKPASLNDSAKFELVADGYEYTYTLPANNSNTVTIEVEEIRGESTPAEGDSSTLLVTLIYYGGEDIASMTSEEIAEALEDATLNVILIDREQRRCNMLKAPDENDDPMVAKFSTMDENGDQLIYTVYANGVTETQTIERGADGPVVPVQPSAGGTQRVWYFDSWQDALDWNADPENAQNQVQAGDYLYSTYTDGLETSVRLYRVTGDPSDPLEAVLTGAGDFIINVYDAGLGPTTTATIAQAQAAYAEKRAIRLLTEDNILLSPNNADWGVSNGRPVPVRLYFSAQKVTPTGPVLKSYILDAGGLRSQERDVGRLLGIKRIFVAATEDQQTGTISYALADPPSDFGYLDLVDYNHLVGMAIDGADVRLAVKTNLSEWNEYHLMRAALTGSPPGLYFMGAATDGNVIRLQMFLLTSLGAVYETGGFAGPYIPPVSVSAEGKVPTVTGGTVVWAAVPETTTSEIDAIIAAI